MPDEMIEDLKTLVDAGELSREGIVREAVADFLAKDRMERSSRTPEADRVILAAAGRVIVNARYGGRP